MATEESEVQHWWSVYILEGGWGGGLEWYIWWILIVVTLFRFSVARIGDRKPDKTTVQCLSRFFVTVLRGPLYCRTLTSPSVVYNSRGRHEAKGGLGSEMVGWMSAHPSLCVVQEVGMRRC